MKLSYSIPINLKSRCKFCGTEPNQYFYVGNKRVNKNLTPKPMRVNIVSDLYLHSSPRYFNSISVFSLKTDTPCKIGTKFFRSHKDRYIGESLTNTLVMLALTCECNKTMWLTSREIRDNKSTKFFDKNFRYLK